MRYILFKSWQGPQGQGPTIHLLLCVSVIRVDTDGYDSKSDTTYFGTLCKCAINKIPHLAMGLQCERDGGMISQGIGRGVSQTLEPIG